MKKVKVGDVWSRNGNDRKFLVREIRDKCALIEEIADIQGNSFLRDFDYMNENYTKMDPVLCIECGTAKARRDNTTEYAFGLKCWSCYE